MMKLQNKICVKSKNIINNGSLIIISKSDSLAIMISLSVTPTLCKFWVKLNVHTT